MATPYAGVMKVHFLPACADISAPTTTEITAGDDLTPHMPKDGLSEGISNQRIDDSVLSSPFNPEDVGDWGAPLSITLVRSAAMETLLGTRGTTGFVLVGPDGDSADDPARVYPVKSMVPEYPPSAGNERQKMTVQFAVTSTPDLAATITAGA